MILCALGLIIESYNGIGLSSEVSYSSRRYLRNLSDDRSDVYAAYNSQYIFILKNKLNWRISLNVNILNDNNGENPT